MNTFEIRESDLISNPSTRLPICLCLDASPSMSGNPSWGAAPGTVGVPIDELNEGVKTFYAALREDPVAHRSAEIAIVAYSSERVVVRNFSTIGDENPPVITLHGEGTHIGRAVEQCLDMLEARKREYSAAGVEYYQPWLVLMTDGRPTDLSHTQAGPRAAGLVGDRKLTVFPIGVGSGADLSTLALFSPRTQPVKLKEMRFAEFFEWLSSSVSCVSRSQVDQGVALDTGAMKGWAEI